jgi:YD repeat-containing protein
LWDSQENYIPPDVGAGANLTHYDYNIDHQLELVTRPDGLTIDSVYDAADRLDSITIPRGTIDLSYKFDRAVRVCLTPDLTTFADGTIVTRRPGPDPRWGMSAPITKVLEVSTPSGLHSVQQTERQASLLDEDDPLSFTELYETTDINGRVYTSYYEAASRTQTETSPEGRRTVTELDPQGRVIAYQVDGLAPVSFGYDNRGRLTSMVDGEGVDARAYGVTYDPDEFVDRITDPMGRTVSFDYDPAGRLTRQVLPDGREVYYGYDEHGNVRFVTPPGRPAHEFTYDPVDSQENYIPPDVGAGHGRRGWRGWCWVGPRSLQHLLDELVQGGGGGAAGELIADFAVFDQHQGGQRLDGEAQGGLGALVDVDLAHLQPALVVGRQPVDHGLHRLAGPAHGSPEVEQRGQLGLEDGGLEVVVVDFDDMLAGHGLGSSRSARVLARQTDPTIPHGTAAFNAGEKSAAAGGGGFSFRLPGRWTRRSEA